MKLLVEKMEDSYITDRKGKIIILDHFTALRDFCTSEMNGWVEYDWGDKIAITS